MSVRAVRGRNWVVDGSPFVISFPHGPGGSCANSQAASILFSRPSLMRGGRLSRGGLEKTPSFFSEFARDNVTLR